MVISEPADKRKEYLENMIFHAPAQKAISEARMAGVSEDSIREAIAHHEKMCAKGGISKGHLE